MELIGIGVTLHTLRTRSLPSEHPSINKLSWAAGRVRTGATAYYLRDRSLGRVAEIFKQVTSKTGVISW